MISDPTDPLLGVDLLVPWRSGWSIDVGVDLVFASGGDLAILSADVLLDLALAGATRAWVGGGPAPVFNDPVPGSDDVGGAVGVLAGVGVPLSDGILPYLQGKVLIADRTRIEVMVGVRF